MLARLAALLVALLAIVLSTLIVAGFAGALHPALDSLAHFRVHLAALSVPAGLALALLYGWREGLAAALPSVLALASAMPAYWPAPVAAPAGPVYTALHVNLRFDNSDQAALLSVIAGANADVLLLAEVSEAWRARLAPLRAAFPHRIDCPGRGRVGGTAILSRRAFAAPGACHGAGALAVAVVDFGGRAVTLAETHLDWPWPHRQAERVAALVPAFAALPPASLLAGDFNAAPWSATAARIAAAGRLKPVPGLGATWFPVIGAARLARLGLPLDQAMLGTGLDLIEATTLAAPGSDHRALRLRFAVKSAAPAVTVALPYQAASMSWRSWSRPAASWPPLVARR